MKKSILIIIMLTIVSCLKAETLSRLNNTILEVQQSGNSRYRFMVRESKSDGVVPLFTRTYSSYRLDLPDAGYEWLTLFLSCYFRDTSKSRYKPESFLCNVMASDGKTVRIECDRTNFLELDHNSITYKSGKPVDTPAQICSLSEKLTFTVYDDADGDGLKDIEEYDVYGAWPGLADTDNDGLLDGEEVKTTKTRPMLYDTDGDGIGDKDDSNPLKPYFCESYSEWTKHWKRVAASLIPYDESWKSKNLNLLDNENLDFDGDGFSNKVEFQKRTSPIFMPGPPAIVFSEKELVRSTACDTQKSFEMFVLSHNSVTGLLCISQANLPVTFELDKLQFLPQAKLPKPPSASHSRMFLARYGLPLQFNVTLPKAAKGDVAREDIYVLCNTGRPSQTLPVVSMAGGATGDNYIVPPELFSPASGSVVRNSYITFNWNGDFKSYRLIVFSPEWEAIIDRDVSTIEFDHDFLKLPSGRYYWTVTGENRKGYKASSAYGSFIYLNPEYDSKDSDEDGYTDNDEYLNGTDPNNASEWPLNFKNSGDTLIKARCGQYFSQTLKVDGGVGQKTWYAKGELPKGVELMWNGILCGVPEKMKIVSILVMVCDEAGHSIERSYTLHVQDSISSKCLSGGGSFGKQENEPL